MSSDLSPPPAETPADAIAIIGLAVRFPGADSVEAFWANLRHGVESVTFFTPEELRAAGVDPTTLADPAYVRANGVLADVDRFDADFFGMTPREAALTDPQHRIFLEVAWEVFERAGYDPARAPGPVGVFAGAGLSTYLLHHLANNPAVVASAGELALLLGNNKDFVPTRTSYKLDLRGPSVNVNTACSTSLVAVHLACQSLLDHHCDLALAGGVAVQLPQDRGYRYTEGGIGSPDGHCRAFDAAAAGTVSGNGCGVVLLRRLEDALADGDPIHAVIRGSAVNNDGADKAGFTAPSVGGQRRVIAEALAVAGVEPAEVSYVEAHGTGTPLGDPIEVAALAEVFAGMPAGTCGLGSVKTNFGHLDEAAGLAGLAKTVLALAHRELPPSLHFTAPNPRLDLAATPFRVIAAPEAWRVSNNQLRRAGVSSFGIGGTNAHVVLEEAPLHPASAPASGPYLLRLSARTPAALARQRVRLADWLEAHPEANLADVAFTLAAGRRAFPHRATVVATDPREAATALRPHPAPATPAAPEVAPDWIGLCSGQGAPYVGMLAQLARESPTVDSILVEGAALLRPTLGLDLRDLLTTTDPAALARVPDTAVAQPAVFLADYALARWWLEQAPAPAALIGHSLGEYVAACLAGVLSLADALQLVATRGALMAALPPGGMLAVGLDEDAATALADRHELDLAAVNAPAACVVSGPLAAIAAATAELADRDIAHTRLTTSHAFHSRMIDPMLGAFATELRKISLRPPSARILSGVTGDWLSDAEATDPTYWVRHTRAPVRFAAALATATGGLRAPRCVEMGPGRALAAMARRCSDDSNTPRIFTSTGRDATTSGGLTHLLASAGQLWCAGIPIHPPAAGRRIVLPTYPFERQRHWIDAPEVQPETSVPAAALPDVSRWFHALNWTPTPRPLRPPARPGPVALLGTPAPLVATCLSALHNAGHPIVSDPVGAGHVFFFVTPGEDALDSVTQLAATLGRTSVPITLSLITTDGPDAPFAALLDGPVRTIPREFPHLLGRRLIFPSAQTDIAAELVAELAAGTREPSVLFREGQRFTLGVKQTILADTAPFLLRPGGTYLITGGLGSMGRVFGRELARTHQARLIMLGRHVDDPGHQDHLAALTALGAEVLPVSCDLIDLAAVSAALTKARARFGPIHGVIHTATGYNQGPLLHRRTGERAAAIAAKVDGLRNLITALATSSTDAAPLDFLWLCSSLAAVCPEPGQVDYAAANAFLDAFAADYQQRTGTATLSIGWGVWQELGLMAHSGLPIAQQDAVRVEIEREGWAQAGVAIIRELFARGAGVNHRLVSPHPIKLPTPPAHPWLTRRWTDPAGRISYLTHLQPSRHWVVDEHRIDNQALLPGTGFLELALAAFTAETGAITVELSEVYLLSPLAFTADEAREVRIVLQPGAFVIVSRVGDDAWLEHARGEIRAIPPAEVEPTTAPPPPPKTGGEPPPVDAIRFGPRWHNLRTVTFEGDHGWAELALPTGAQTDLLDYALHPALLDMATGFITLRHGLAASLPFNYRRLVVHRPLPATFRSHVQVTGRSAEDLELAATLTDEAGQPLVSIEGYRLRRIAPSTIGAPTVPADQARLTLQPGLEGGPFFIRPAHRRTPGAGEVEIAVEAAGLNFIEVLYAHGMLPAAPELEDRFGLECAGRIVRVGTDVTAFTPGDAVIAFANGCFASYVTTPAKAVAPRPVGLNAAAAATLPTAYTTAHHALLTQARLAPGERVLIHAATGGVGLAAVHIARHLGAEVYATAGSETKRAYLRELGVAHVMDSRSLDFATEVLRLTDGRGVDVVLNSLGGDFLHRSLELVAPHGRFVELGKRDLLGGGCLALQQFARIISFIVIDVGPDLPGFPALWREVAARVAEGVYAPLPHTSWPLATPAPAFAFMAQARHLGKVVLALDAPATLQAAAVAPPPTRPGRPLAAILGEPAGRESAATPDPTGSPASPATAADEIERTIAAIWRELLGVAHVGPDENFFELRGDSLLAAQIVARIQTALGAKLPLSALFDAPTVAGLAARVRPPVAAGELEEGTL